MARYDLPPIQSMYRDPQSVKINTELRQRFVENFAADDQLAAAVDAMDSAEFEGDLAAKQKFTEEYNALIDKRSTQRDYENMGMAIARDARSFVKDYTPLKENKKAYDTWKALVDKSHESYNTQKGGLDAEDYKNLIAAAKHDYKGLQYDEEGNLIEGSKFTGDDFVRSVDLVDEINQSLNNIQPDEYSNLGIESPIGDITLNADGTMKIHSGIENKRPVYWVMTKSGREYVNSDRVADLAMRVVNKPEIQESLKQKVALRSHALTEEQATTAVNEELTNIDSRLLELQNKSNLTRAEEYEATALKDQKTRILEGRSEDGDMQVLREIEKDKIVTNAVGFGVGKYAFNRYVEGKSYRADEYERGRQSKGGNVPVKTRVDIEAPQDDIDQADKPTFEERKENIVENRTKVQDILVNDFKFGKNDVTDEKVDALLGELTKSLYLPPEELKNIADKHNMDVGFYRQKIQEIAGLLRNNELTDLRNTDSLKQAAVVNKQLEVFNLNTLDDNMPAEYILDYVRTIPGRENLTPVEILDYIKSKETTRPIQSREGTTEQVYNPFLDKMADDLAIKYPNHPNTFGSLKGEFRSNLDEWINQATKKHQKILEEVEENYKNSIKTQATILTNYGPHDDNMREAFADFYSTIPSTFKVWEYGDSESEETIKDIVGDRKYKVVEAQSGLTASARPDGTPLLAITIKYDDTGETKLVYADANQVKTQDNFGGNPMAEYLASPEYQVSLIWGAGIHHQVVNTASRTWTPKEFGGEVVFVYDSNPKKVGNQEVIIINKKRFSKEEGIKMIADNLRARQLAGQE